MKTKVCVSRSIGFKIQWVISFLLFTLIVQAQSGLHIQGSIGKSDGSQDSNKVIIYGIANGMIANGVFENMNICISLPDQGQNNPIVQISQNFMQSLVWTYAGANFPDVIGGRAYYTFIGTDNETNSQLTWQANKAYPLIEFSFTHGIGQSRVQLNDLTGSLGIGDGGGPSYQSFWYVQLNSHGDLTDYQNKFFKSDKSSDPFNGGLNGESYVETSTNIALKLSDIEKWNWLIYPNPSKGRIHVVPPVTGLLNINLSLLGGEILNSQKIFANSGQPISMDCAVDHDGVILLEIRNDKNELLLSEKLVIQ